MLHIRFEISPNFCGQCVIPFVSFSRNEKQYSARCAILRIPWYFSHSFIKRSCREKTTQLTLVSSKLNY